jgi:hypothetical protein
VVTVAVPFMAKKTPQEFCEYVSVKMDEAVHPIARAAAALAGISTQELISNAVNEVASRLLKRDPVKRLPPRPKEKRKPRE